ncbi:DUF5615 family PIN-like protein [Nocardioides zeae]
MRFLVDAQLPPALAGLLREHGHAAEHVIDIGPADAPDGALWRYALAHSAVIVTKDEDFADMVAVGGTTPPSCGYARATSGAPHSSPGSTL